MISDSKASTLKLSEQTADSDKFTRFAKTHSNDDSPKSTNTSNLKSGKHLINTRQMSSFYKQVDKEKENNYTTLLEDAYNLISRIQQKNQEINSLDTILVAPIKEGQTDDKALLVKNGFLVDTKLSKLQTQNKDLKQKIAALEKVSSRQVSSYKLNNDGKSGYLKSKPNLQMYSKNYEQFGTSDNRVVLMSREHIKQEILKVQAEIDHLESFNKKASKSRIHVAPLDLDKSNREGDTLQENTHPNYQFNIQALHNEINDLKHMCVDETKKISLIKEVVTKLQIENMKIKEQEMQYKTASERQKDVFNKYSDSEVKLQKLREKEILLNAKVSELLQNPLFANKKQGFELENNIENKEKDYLAIQSENGKLKFLCEDRDVEIKEITTKIDELKSQNASKQSQIEQIANFYTKVDIKAKFNEFVGECSKDSSGESMTNIYETLISALEEVSLNGNKNSAIQEILKQKQSLIKNLKSFDINNNNQSVQQILLQSLKAELTQTSSELEYLKSQQKHDSASAQKIQPLLSHLNKLKAIYSYLSSLTNGTKSLDQLIKEGKTLLNEAKFSDSEIHAFDKLPVENSNSLLLSLQEYKLDFNKFHVETHGDFQILFTLKFLNYEALWFSGKNKALTDINVERMIDFSVYSKLDIIKLMSEKLTIFVTLEQDGRKRTIGRCEFRLKNLFTKYIEAIQTRTNEIGCRTLDLNLPVYFNDLATNLTNEIGLIAYKVAIKSQFSEYFNNFLISEFGESKIYTLTFRLISGFGFDPSGKYYADIQIPKLAISNLKDKHLGNEQINIAEDMHTVKLTSKSKFGENPFFEFECEFDVDLGSNFINLPIDVIIYDRNKDQSGAGVLVGYSKFVLSKLIADQKLVEELSVENFVSNLPQGRHRKSTILVAAFNKPSYKNDIKIFEKFYNKDWFFETTRTISEIIQSKQKRKEILLETVFGKEKVNILPAEFLSCIFNVEDSEIENHPLKGSTDQQPESRVLFANKFEFLLYWKYLVHSENFWKFFKDEMNNHKDALAAKERNPMVTLKRPNRFKEFELLDKNFITKKHFTFMFFEFQKENPKTTNLVEKLNEVQVVSQLEKPKLSQPLLTSEPINAISLPEIISQIQSKIKEYKRQNKLSDCDLILLFDKNDDGLMQKDELKNCLTELSIEIQKENLDLLFSLLDRDNSGSLTIIEIMKLVELEPREILRATSNDKYFVDKYTTFRSDKVLKNYIDAVENFLRTNDLTYFQFFDKCKLVDEKSKSIREINLSKFMEITKNVIGLRELKSDDLGLIFKKIDKDGSETLSFDEFCEFLGLRRIFEIVESSEFNTQVENCPFLEVIWNFATKYKMSLEQLFAEIDDDKNGELSKQEMFVYFKNLFNIQKKPFNVKDFESFLNLIEKSDQVAIHFVDLKKVLSAYEIYKRTPKVVPKLFFDDLLLKLRDIIRTGRFRLKINFECEEEEKGIISVENFKDILEESNKFMDEEIKVIINPIALPFTKFERINYENFLNLCEFYENELREIEKSRDTSVVKVFKILKDISVKYNYDKYLLFSLLDKYNEGFITGSTMCEVFKDIGLEFEESAIHNSFKLIDTSEDGRIDMREFMAFMDEIK